MKPNNPNYDLFVWVKGNLILPKNVILQDKDFAIQCLPHFTRCDNILLHLEHSNHHKFCVAVNTNDVRKLILENKKMRIVMKKIRQTNYEVEV